MGNSYTNRLTGMHWGPSHSHRDGEVSPPRTGPPVWARRWLIAAGVYNLLWGAVTIAFPQLQFDLAGVERLNHPEVWQCVGMIVGVYGIGYLLAAHDPRRHWPIVLVGLLGKLFGPLGFLLALRAGTLPPQFGWTLLTNDLIWWIPFALILRDAALHQEYQAMSASLEHFVKESRIDAPVEAVFGFHESPEALRQLIPPWERMRIVEASGTLRPGSRVVLQGWAGFLPVRWVAVHTEYDPPRLFADRQEKGPFAYWYHRHRFLDDGLGGTILRDEVEYRLPLGWLGRWLAGAFIRRKLERMFAYRHETTRRLVEAAARVHAAETVLEHPA